MGIDIHYKTTCDGCGLVIERDVVLNEKTAEDIMEQTDYGDGMIATSTAVDMWSWGLPDEWLQVPFDEVTKRHYLLFHNDNCYIAWLRSQERFSEINDIENGSWIA